MTRASWRRSGHGSLGAGGSSAPTPATDVTSREREVREVVAAIKGRDSRRFVRELAEATVHGHGIALDGALLARYGKTTGTAFTGIVGGPNKLMRRIAGRDLILLDRTLQGWTLDPLDAELVLDATTVE